MATKLKVGNFPGWQPANHCTGGPAPGTRALMAWFVEEYGDKGGFNLGIYSCRSVRGAATTSMHGEGRAGDLGFPVGDKDGDECLRRLLPHVGALGIQAIIYERVIYSAKSPTGRPYPGLVPHWDHLHVEQTREAAERLTLATIRSVLSPKPKKPGDRALRVGMKGADVRFVQRELGIHPIDGIFGPATRRGVRRWERVQQAAGHKHLVVDGVVGALTWKILGVEPKF